MIDSKFYEGKNVLVTGGAGLSGHQAIKSLLELGANVRATQYKNRKVKIKNDKLEIVKCDLFKPEDCDKVTKDIDIVVSTVAFLRGAKGQTENPMQLVRNNLIPSINIMESSCKNKVKLFGFMGSSTAYKDTSKPVKEKEAFVGDPPSVYTGVGEMKRYCERVAKYFHSISDTKFALIRTTAIYGPHDTFDPEKCHAIPELIMKGSRRMDPYIIWGNGKQIRDFVYVEDVIDGLLLTIEKYPTADIINIATGKDVTVLDTVKTICNIYEYKPKFEFDTTKPSMIKARRIDVSKAKKILGFKAKYSLEEGMSETIKWYEENKDKLVPKEKKEDINV